MDTFSSKESRASVAVAVDGRLYAAAARSSPGTWNDESGADAILVESTDNGDTFETISYPGEPAEVVLTWTAVDGNMLAGRTTVDSLAAMLTGCGPMQDGFQLGFNRWLSANPITGWMTLGSIHLFLSEEMMPSQIYHSPHSFG